MEFLIILVILGFGCVISGVLIAKAAKQDD